MLFHKQVKGKGQVHTKLYEVVRDVEERMNHWRETVKCLTAQTETYVIDCLMAFVREQELKQQAYESKNIYLPSCSGKCARKFH